MQGMLSGIIDRFKDANGLQNLAGCVRLLRRSFVNNILQELMASLNLAELPGLVSILERLGGWMANGQPGGTMWRVYVSQNTDHACSHVTHIAAGRPPGPRMSAVRLQALRHGALSTDGLIGGNADVVGECQ